ncbi:MAG: hypothetical protein J6D47_11905 [Peptostreptococcaceae bacterium]|nr:hypothetical protein [Peptostreptococcaceae bacterium]
MKTKIKNIDTLGKYINLAPGIVLQDVDKRITDWLLSGGSLEDDYIKQQHKYIEMYIEMENKLNSII